MNEVEKAAYEKWGKACEALRVWVKDNKDPNLSPPAHLINAVLKTHHEYKVAKGEAVIPLTWGDA